MVTVHAEQPVRSAIQTKAPQAGQGLPLGHQVTVQHQLPLPIGQQDRGGRRRPETLMPAVIETQFGLQQSQHGMQFSRNRAQLQAPDGHEPLQAAQFRQHRRQRDARQALEQVEMVLAQHRGRQLGRAQQLQGLLVGQRAALGQAAAPLHRIHVEQGLVRTETGCFQRQLWQQRPDRLIRLLHEPLLPLPCQRQRLAPLEWCDQVTARGLAVEAPGARGALQQHDAQAAPGLDRADHAVVVAIKFRAQGRQHLEDLLVGRLDLVPVLQPVRVEIVAQVPGLGPVTIDLAEAALDVQPQFPAQVAGRLQGQQIDQVLGARDPCRSGMQRPGVHDLQPALQIGFGLLFGLQALRLGPRLRRTRLLCGGQ